MSNLGPVILIFHKTAYTGNNKSIISSTQLEHYHNRVDDRSTLAGSTQRISTADGYIFPLSIKQGLPYLRMRPYTTHEFLNTPHVVMMSDKVWYPTYADNDIDPYDPSSVDNTSPATSRQVRSVWRIHSPYRLQSGCQWLC